MISDKAPEEDIQALWEALSRAGGHWSDEVVLRAEAEGNGFTAVFYLIDELPKLSQIAISRFIRAFLTERGWESSTRFSPRYVRIEISKA